MIAVKAAFAMQTVDVPLDGLLPSRPLRPEVKESTRYKTIAASVREVGIVEPVIVYPQAGKGSGYVVLDGHVRIEVLREMGAAEATCVVASDDENASYNDSVSHLSPIQEIKMILKAMDDGVPEDLIARALNVSPRTIRENRTRLQDIAPEAIDLLKDKPIADLALRLFKKAKPFRQVEMAEVMNLSRTYTAAYAKTLLLATPPEELVAPLKGQPRPEELAKLEVEMRVNERDFVALEESYSRDTLNLQLARAYLKALLENKRIDRYLAQKHGDLLEQLRKVVDATSLEG